MFGLFKRKPVDPAPEQIAAPAVNLADMTGQPFTITTRPTAEEVAFHKAQIPRIEQSIADLKAAHKDASTYERYLAFHRDVVEKYDG